MEALSLALLFLVLPPLTIGVVASVVLSGLALWREQGTRRRLLALERAISERGAGLSPVGSSVVATAIEAPADGDLEREDAPTHETDAGEPPGSEDPTAPPGGPAVVPWTVPSPERVAVWVASLLGGLLVVLASLFTLAVAFDRGWLGPAPRVSLGLVLGTIAWGAGAALRLRAFRVVGAGLGGAGLGTIYGSLFAATSLYDLLSPTVAFGFMVAVTAVALAEATRHDSRFLAHLGLVGGLLTPILVSSGQDNPVGLFGYLVLLMAGSQAAAYRRRWWDLTFVAALGAFGYHVGWTATWYAADRAPIAVLAVVGLSLPFAFVAATPGKQTAVVRGVAVAALGALGLAALPWMGPLDPVFRDPRTGIEVVRQYPGAAWWGALALLAVPALAWLPARVRRSAPTALIGSATTALLLVAFAIAWGRHPAPPGWVLAAGSVAPVALAMLVFARRPHVALGAVLLPAWAGWSAAGWLAVASTTGSVYAATAVALSLFGVGLGLTSGLGWAHLATLLGIVPILGLGVARVETLGAAFVAGPLLVAYGSLATVPLRAASRDRHAATAIAALTPLFLYGPLHGLWVHLLGPSFVGVLPLLLGAVALMGALVLLRAYRVDVRSGALALFVGVALLGITAAVPVQLSSQWLTVAWALEVAALAALARRLEHPLLRVAAVLLASAVAVRLLTNPWALAYGDTSGWPILNWTLYTWGVPALALLVAARAYPVRSRFERWVPGALLVSSILVAFALVNVQVSHLFQDAGPIELGGASLVQGMVRSLAWAAFGVAVLVAGLFAQGRIVRLVGFAIVLLATAKVFVFDLWALEGFVRVGSVLGLGVSLLLAAFLFERLVLRQPART